MNKWGNGDPNFNKILLKIFNNDSPEFRKKIYYFICIIFRFILYTSLIFIIKNDYVIYVLLFLSLFSSYNLYTNIKLNNQNQWWSKKFQLLISLFVLLFSILSIYNKNEYNYRKFIIITLYISLFGGIIQSINNL